MGGMSGPGRCAPAARSRVGTVAALIAVLAGVMAPLTGSLVVPGGALADTAPLTPGVPSLGSPTSTPTTSTEITVATSGSSSDSGLSGTSAIVIALGALIVIAAIGYVIWRDARRHAPAAGRAAERGSELLGEGARKATKARPKPPRKLSAAEKRRRKRGRAR